MRAGFIGAGKVGCSLGKYLSTHGVEVAGYYDRDTRAAAEAAEFSAAKCYEDMHRLAADCDIIFLTVPDGLIASVCEELSKGAGSTDPAAVLRGRFVVHCSGSLSSEEVLASAAAAGAYTYSLHPLFAVSSRFETYRELGSAYFSLEGDPDHLDELRTLLAKAGLTIRAIDPASKTKYHLAAVYASNLICGLLGKAGQLLQECGFGEDEAMTALAPLIRGNVEHAIAVGPVQALTGPVERGDAMTIRKHLAVCSSEEDRQLYRLLSRRLLAQAKAKHPDRDYAELEKLLFG